MTFTPALAAGNYTKLRSTPYAAAQYVSVVPNTNVVSSTVLTVPATTTITQITLNDTPTGARAGQTVLISATNDRRAAYFRGRIRKAPSGDTIFINETSAEISVADFVWILDDYDLHAKLPVDNGTTYWKDFDETFHVPNPFFYNLPSSIAGFVDDTGFITIPFAPLFILPNPDATTISTWLWEEGDGTYTVGNSASQNPTIKFPPGFRHVHVTGTDDVGRSQVFHIQVHAHDQGDSATYPPALDFRGSEISNTLAEGWTASLGAFAGVSTMLDRTAVTVWSQEYYGGVEGNLYSQVGRVEFTGRLRSESNVGTGDETYSFLKDVSFPGEGIGTRLAALDALPLAIRNEGTPSIWDELEDMTVWRAIVHYLDSMTTFLTIHSLFLDDTTDDFLAKELGTTDGRVLGAINELAQSVNAAFEFGPDGQTQIIRSARYMLKADRDALTTLADFEDQDLIDITLDRDYTDPVGQVEADGGVFNTSSNQVSVAFSFAPGHAQGEGGDKTALRGQILEANTSLDTARGELNFRAGQHLVKANPLDTLTVQAPPGYHAFVASNGAYFTWTLNGDQNVRGLVYDTGDRWLLSGLSFVNDNDTGARDTSLTFQAIGEPASSGDTYIPPASEQVKNPHENVPIDPPYEILTGPPIDPKDSEWPPSEEWLTNGQTAVVGTANNLWAAHGFLGNEINYVDITPSPGDEVKAFAFGPDGSRAYCLMHDGSDSHVYTTTEIKDALVVWTQGETLLGEYNDIRLGEDSGEIYVYSNGLGAASSFSHTWDFTAADGSFSPCALPDPAGAYSAGNGWTTTDEQEAGGVNSSRIFNICRSFSDRFITSISHTYDGVAGTYNPANQQNVSDQIKGALDGTPEYNSTVAFSTGNGQTRTVYPNDTFDEISFILRSSFKGPSPPAWSGSALLTASTVTGTGSNPFGGGGTSATTAYSTDHGATIDSYEVVGDSPATAGGIDTVTVGDVALAGQDAKVRTATSGGVWADEANGAVAGSNPTLIAIPYFQFNSSTANINDATPEYLLGVDTAVAGASLWRVTDAGKADVSITIAATLALYTSPNAAAFSWYDNGKFAVLAEVSGTPHLVTTTNAFTANTDRGALDADAIYVRMNKADMASVQLFIADGGAGPAYSLNFGADIINQPWPSTDDVILIEPYSGQG